MPAQFRVLVIRRPEVRLPRLRGRGGAGARAGAADRGRAADRSARSRRCSSPNTPIIFRSTARPRSTPGRASISTARPWPTGSAGPPSMLRPVHERLLDRLKASAKLFADETTAPVLDPGRGRTKTGQLWAYARDDRPWGGTDPPGVAYVYAPDRKAEQPDRASRRLPGRPAGRRLRGLQGAGRARRGAARLLLVAMSAGAFTNSPRAARRRSPPRRSRASPSSTGSRARSAAARPTSAAPSARSAAGRSSRRSSPGCARSSRSSARRPSSPRRSAMRSRAGRACACSSTTAGSRSTPTWSSAACARWRRGVHSAPLLQVSENIEV